MPPSPEPTTPRSMILALTLLSAVAITEGVMGLFVAT